MLPVYFIEELASILAELYPDEADSRHVVLEAELNEGFISYSSRSIQTWHNIVHEASKTNKIDSLFNVVRSHYDENPSLEHIYEVYQESVRTKEANAAEQRLKSSFRIPDPRDNIWQFLGVVIGGLLAIVGIILSVWFFIAGRPYKALTYEVLSSSAVIVNPAATDKIEVLYNGVPVPDARLTLIRITNTGNVSVPAQDFGGQPLTIESNGGKILSTDVIETKPENLAPQEWKTETNQQGNAVNVPPLLLNEDDSFTVQLISDKEITIVDVDARITDIKEITLYSPPSSILTNAAIIVASVLLAIAVQLLLVFFSRLIRGSIRDK